MTDNLLNFSEMFEQLKNSPELSGVDSEELNKVETLIKTNPILSNEDMLKEIVAFFQLDDDNFAVLAGTFLRNYKNLFTDPISKIQYMETLKENDVTVEGLKEGATALFAALNDEKEFHLSEVKRTFLASLFGITIDALEDEKAIAKRKIMVPIELSEDAQIPTYANVTDAGADIYSIEDVTVHPGETVLVHTGIKVAIPDGYEIQIRPRSGLSLKTNMRIANAPGTIDAGYRDEIGVIVTNIDNPIKDITYEFDKDGRPIITSILHGSDISITKGQKIAQMVLSPVPRIEFIPVHKLIEDGNRGGGFGHTG